LTPAQKLNILSRVKLETKIKRIKKIIFSPIKLFKISANQFINKSRNLPEYAGKTKESVSRARKKTIAFYRRPMRDISHVSIIFVIILALFSGVTASVGTKERVTINPFVAEPYTTQAVVSQTQERLYEADTVATLSGIYSDQLGMDAIKEAENLNAKLTSSTTSSDYIASQPIVAMADSGTRTTITSYTVKNGDTVWSIAQNFNITTDTIRYNNKLEDENSVKPGQTLVILPVSGILHTVKAGDTTASISKRYQIDEALIISQNDLYGEEVKPGMKLVIPDAEIPAAPTPAPSASSGGNSGYRSGGNSGISYVKLSYGPNHFPWGYCTWWVAQKRYVPWSGDAWQWYYNAQAYGRAVGRTPVPGAIMVTWESGIGHVAYVESVSGGSFTVSEMNYRGYGIVSSRTISTSSVPLIGFIY